MYFFVRLDKEFPGDESLCRLFIFIFMTNASVDLIRPYRVNDFMYFYYINKWGLPSPNRQGCVYIIFQYVLCMQLFLVWVSLSQCGIWQFFWTLLCGCESCDTKLENCAILVLKSMIYWLCVGPTCLGLALNMSILFRMLGLPSNMSK